MIDTLISAVVTVLGWIISGISDIAYAFYRISTYVKDIPGVGAILQTMFVSVQSFFNALGYDVAHFSTRVQNVLNAINDWLETVDDIAGDVYGWISDKLSDAFSWANNAWDWVVDTGTDLFNDVHGWISDKLNDAYRWADNALDWVATTGQNLWRDVYGWISDKLNDAYTWANNAWTWISDFPSHVADFLETIKADLLQFFGPVYNLVSFFFDDINLFFSDPPAYFEKKLTDLGETFAERFWAFVEAIIEKIW